MPVIATYTYLFSRHLVPLEWRSLVVFLLAVLGVIVLHSAGNLLSDWADFRSGVDNEQAYAIPNLVFGHFKPAEYLHASILLFVAGGLIGAGIVLLSGPTILLIGAAGVLLTIHYYCNTVCKETDSCLESCQKHIGNDTNQTGANNL